MQINGEEQEVAEGLTLSELVKQWSLQPERLAIELNRMVVPRREWPTTMLVEGDRLEIVHFVGGGAVETADRAPGSPAGQPRWGGSAAATALWIPLRLGAFA